MFRPVSRFRARLAFGGAILASGLVAALAAAGTNATAPKIALPTTTPMSAEDAAGVQARIETLKLVGGDDIPGVLVGVWDPVKGYFKGGAGVADTTSKRTPTPADAFRVGSLTKTFTATVILQLVSEGKLRLDGRVATYVPRLVKRHPELGTRTIRQLLTMRSGLPEYTDALVGSAVAKGWTTKVWTPNQLIDFAFKAGPVKASGAIPAVYTNTNYITLGEIAQAVTGKTLPVLVRTRLLQPLALKKTLYPRITDTALPGPSTRGYVGPEGAAESGVEPNTDVTGWSASWGGAAGIMMSTIDDVGRWAAARFGSATLPAKLRTQRAAVAVPLNAGGTYGLGLQRFGEWEGHFGGIPGWTTMAYRSTKTGAIVVASVNGCCGPQSALMAQFLINGLYPGTFPLQ